MGRNTLSKERIKYLKLCRGAENFGYVLDSKEQEDWKQYVVHTRKSTQDQE